MIRIEANGSWGPGVILDPEQVAQALTWAKQPADFYLKNPEWGNNRNQARTVDNNHTGFLAEYGVREFMGLPHDSHLRKGRADLGTRTDIKGIVKPFHKLVCMERAFNTSWRYLLAWTDDLGDGRIAVRVQGWTEGTNARWKFYPEGMDESTDDPRPCWGIRQEYLSVQGYQVGYVWDRITDW